eukprot:scaffold2393_cov267-Pinguiococcus_pyrenoidosus.AAC.25
MMEAERTPKASAPLRLTESFRLSPQLQSGSTKLLKAQPGSLRNSIVINPFEKLGAPPKSPKVDACPGRIIGLDPCPDSDEDEEEGEGEDKADEEIENEKVCPHASQHTCLSYLALLAKLLG